MSLRLLDAGSLAAGAVNEDAWGVAGACAWVLDGATGLGRNVVSSNSDAAWFAQGLHAALQARLADPAASLSQGLEQALEGLAGLYAAALARSAGCDGPAGAIEPYEFPSAAGLLLRAEAGRVEAIWLGDCRAYWLEGGALRSLGGGMIDTLDDASLTALKAFFAANPQASLAEGRAHVWPLLRRQRTQMNQEGGYWAWAPQEGLLARAHRGEIPRGVGPVLLASDGFTRLWDTFSLVSPEEALQACALGEGRRLAESLRAAETADAGGRAFPRFKQYDDCTWLCLEL